MPAAAPGLALPQLLAESPALAAALAGVERAAATDLPALVLGESGSGRSTLARALHGASPRAAGPLVEVDPGAFPSALFESELFGYRPGAFTGAEQAVDGRVARAAGGTLVLDHVEELPLAAQPKLLRLLAERRYAPLGGREVAADVRFVAIAAEDLPARAARGLFRADLFYRLEVLAFRVPPLRERRADLPGLVERLLADLGERLGRPRPRLAAGALDWMMAHPWPGNVRQLRNVLERGLVLAGEEVDPPRPDGAEGERPRRLVELEQEAIRRALAYTRGHQGRAAELLGISRKALWEKRRRFGIP
ncbi:MAG TPA: sigma 54-interacting transcriptional regulator [Thermoanaerobaculia bacterium]|nr:sigma 54-interacting transcriptional regulator [Thermoanaerobaculia bacterium]